MKKLIAMAMLATMAGAARADFAWSWWPGSPDLSKKDCKGCVLGIGSEVKSMQGGQVSVAANMAENVNGGAQVSFGYNRAVKFRNGVQLGFFNRAEKTSLQLGLICFNKGGFLPFFVFFNFDKSMFGAEK